MKIRSIRHKGLKRFIEYNDPSGLPAQFVGKISNIIAFLQDMEDVQEVYSISIWKAHQLTGKRKGTWSLYVSRNWRLTFQVNEKFIEITGLDFEDYH